MEALNDWIKRKILYKKDCVRILFETVNNRVWSDYFKKKSQGSQFIVSIDKKTYFLGNNYRFNSYGVPYYKIKENVVKSLSWEEIAKTDTTLSAQEIDKYTDTKIFLDVMSMTGATEINWKMIGIIGVVIVVIAIIYFKLNEKTGGALAHP